MGQRFLNFWRCRSDYRWVNLLRRPDVHYPIILAVVALAVWSPRLRGPIDLRFDAGVYYILGTSLAEGKGYRLLNEPGEPSAIQYPPLLPALVAVEQKLLGTSDPDVVGAWLRRTYLVLFLVFSLATYRLARGLLSPAYAFAVALICTLSGEFMYLSDLLQAELPFAAVTVLFAISARSLGDGKTQGGVGRFVLTAFLGTAAFLIRSAGVALLGAWVGEAVLRRQWKQVALRCVVAAVPFFAWQGWVAHVRGGAEYASPAYAYQRAPYQYYNVSYVENLLLVDSFKPELGRASGTQLVKRVLKNSLSMPLCIGETVSLSKGYVHWGILVVNRKVGGTLNRPIPRGAAEVFACVIGAATIAGVVMLALRRQWFVVLYLAATLLLICLTPWPRQFLRYLAPAAPFLVIGFVALLAAARERILADPTRDPATRTAIARSIVALLVLIPLMQIGGQAIGFKKRHAPMQPSGPKLFYAGRDWVNWSQAADWVTQHASSKDIVATSAPHLLYLKTGIKSVLPPMESSPDKARRLLDSVPVRYVILGKFEFLDIDQRYAKPAVESQAESWKLVYTGEDRKTCVYERVR